MGSLPNSNSKSFHRLNPHIYGGEVRGDEAYLRKIGALLPHQGKRLRQDTKPLMNKLEQDLFSYLQRLYPKVKLHAQAKKFRLANGLWYKPDITAVFDGREFAWEAKGPHAFRGGFENLKFAATAWPEVKWILIWKDGNGWRSQEILS